MAKEIEVVKKSKEEMLEELRNDALKELDSETTGQSGVTTEEEAGSTTSTETTDGENKASTEETTESHEEDGSAPDGTEDTEELTEEEKARLSEKAQRRFKRLAEEKRKLLEENSFLKSNKGKETEEPKPTKKEDVPGFVPPFTGNVQDVVQAAKEAMRAELEGERTVNEKVNQLREDRIKAEQEYPELNPDLPGFNKDLSDKIVVWYRERFQANPDVRLIDFIDDVMDIRRVSIEKSEEEKRLEISRKKASQPLTGPTVKKGHSSIADDISMANSLEELEALRGKM